MKASKTLTTIVSLGLILVFGGSAFATINPCDINHEVTVASLNPCDVNEAAKTVIVSRNPCDLDLDSQVVTVTTLYGCPSDEMLMIARADTYNPCDLNLEYTSFHITT